MNRLDFLNKVYGMCGTLDWGLVAEPTDITQAVNNYRKGKKRVSLSSYRVDVTDGCLFLDGDFILRVEPLIRPLCADFPKLDYYESRCLEDAED